MKSGKGEGDGYRKEKKYGSGYMYFSYICINKCHFSTKNAIF